MASLVPLFLATQSAVAAEREGAEATLRTTASVTPGFLPALLDLVLTEGGDVATTTIISLPQLSAVKLSAVIYLKNCINRRWGLTQTSAELSAIQSDHPPSNPISPEDKEYIRSRILSGISSMASHPSIRVQLVSCLATLLSHDFQHGKWPGFLDQVQALLSTGVSGSMFCGLVALQELFVLYQWSGPEKRNTLLPIIQSVFPGLLAFAREHLLPHPESTEAGEMMKVVVKTYCKAISLELPTCLSDNVSLVPWGSLFVDLVQIPLPHQQRLSTGSAIQPIPTPGSSEREELLTEWQKLPWWKAKKWAHHALFKLTSRYALNLKGDKKYATFAKTFMAHFAPNILNSYLTQIDRIVAGEWITPRVMQQIGAYLEICIKPKTTWPLLLPHLEKILTYYVYPMLSYSGKDEDVWEEDAVEFIHKRVDPPVDDYRSPVAMAEEFLTALVRDRYKTTFMPVVTFINNMLETYAAAAITGSQNPHQKDGALRMMSVIAEHTMARESPIRAQLPQFLLTHVLPEMSSANRFLRIRACDTLLHFGDIEFEDGDAANGMSKEAPPHPVLQALFQALLVCLKDPELPVRVQAALALPPYLECPSIHAAMRGHVVSIMQELLSLTAAIDIDTLTHVMEMLVSDFADDLAPFAEQLALQLTATFMNVVPSAGAGENGEADMDESENKVMIAMGVLKTLSTLVLAVEASPEILRRLELVYAESLAYVLTHQIMDLYDDVFEIIEGFTFCGKAITPTMWTFFDMLHSVFQAGAYDYMELIAPAMVNYITYDAAHFVQNPARMQKLMDVIRVGMNVDMDLQREDRIHACRLIEALLLHMRGGYLDALIPSFLEMAFAFLKTFIAPTSSSETSESDADKQLLASGDVAVKVHLLEIVIHCLYYNPVLTLSLLEQQAGATQTFLDAWLRELDSFARVHDKRLSVLTLVQLLAMGRAQLPPSLAARTDDMVGGVLTLLESYPTALENREHEDQMRKHGGDDSDDDDDDDDDDEVEGTYTNDDEDDEEEDQEDAEIMTHGVNDEAFISDNEDDFDDDDDAWGLDDYLLEDPFFETPLDKIDPYIQFQDLLHASGEVQEILNSGRLSAKLQKEIPGVLKIADENRVKASVVPAAI